MLGIEAHCGQKPGLLCEILPLGSLGSLGPLGSLCPPSGPPSGPRGPPSGPPSGPTQLTEPQLKTWSPTASRVTAPLC